MDRISRLLTGTERTGILNRKSVIHKFIKINLRVTVLRMHAAMIE